MPSHARPCLAAAEPRVGAEDSNPGVCRSPASIPCLALPRLARPSPASPSPAARGRRGLEPRCLPATHPSIPRLAWPCLAPSSPASPCPATRGCRRLEPRCLPATHPSIPRPASPRPAEPRPAPLGLATRGCRGLEPRCAPCSPSIDQSSESCCRVWSSSAASRCFRSSISSSERSCDDCTFDTASSMRAERMSLRRMYSSW